MIATEKEKVNCALAGRKYWLHGFPGALPRAGTRHASGVQSAAASPAKNVQTPALSSKGGEGVTARPKQS